MHRTKSSKLRVVFDGDVTRQSGAIHENRVVTDEAIVGDVSVRHDEVVAAYPGDAAALHGAAIHGRKFPEVIFVADFERDPFAFVGDVLRLAADDGERVDAIFFAETSRTLHYSVRIEATTFAEFYVVADDRVSANGHTTANFCGR